MQTAASGIGLWAKAGDGNDVIEKYITVQTQASSTSALLARRSLKSCCSTQDLAPAEQGTVS